MTQLLNTMAPSQREQIERLSSENADLREKVNALTEIVDTLKSSLELLSVNHGETAIRVEAVEENLCQVRAEQKDLEQDVTAMMLRLESQQMYSRKQTLLFTGSAVELPLRGEDPREVVIKLLTTHLGIADITKQEITACHRLKNQKVILVRFSHLDTSDRVYRARTRPKRPGLLVFESLTSERLSVIQMLRTMKDDPSSSVVSYFTQSGKIFVKTSESRDVRPVEIPFGCGLAQIRELCEGKKVTPSDTAIRDQFRAVNSRGQLGGASSGRVGDGSQAGAGGQWITASRRGYRSKRAPPPSGKPTGASGNVHGSGSRGASHPGGERSPGAAPVCETQGAPVNGEPGVPCPGGGRLRGASGGHPPGGDGSGGGLPHAQLADPAQVPSGGAPSRDSVSHPVHSNPDSPRS